MSPPSNHDQSISVTFESIRDFNVKMIDMAHANMEAFFGLARQLATAKAPSDILPALRLKWGPGVSMECSR